MKTRLFTDKNIKRIGNFVDDHVSSISNLENDPDNIYVLCSLAEFYDDKGETQNAFEILDNSAEKYPNSIILKTIRLKLEIKEKGLTKSSKKMDEIINEINQRDDHPFSS